MSGEQLTKFITNIWTPLGIIASGAAAVFSFFAQQSANMASAKAAEADKKAEALLVLRRETRQDLSLDRDYQIKVAQLTLESIETSNVKKQRALLALAQSLPDPMGTRLVTALSGSEDAQVAMGAQSTLQATADFDRVNAQRRDQAGAQAPVATPPSTPTAQTTALSPYAPNGWDFDVFWCQGTDLAAGRYDRALKFANALAAESKAGHRIGGQALGRVRLRPLSSIVNARPGYGVYGDVIRADGDETAFAGQVAGFAGKLGTAVTVQSSGTQTHWYLSIFFCR